MSKKKQVFSSRFLDSLFNRPYGNDLYFITDGEYVKIGRANNAYKRLKQLQTGNPKVLSILAYFPKRGYLEGWIHLKFSKYTKDGEWFQLNETIYKLITLLNNGLLNQQDIDELL